MLQKAASPLLNDLQLACVNRRVLRRIVAKPPPPHYGPEDSESSENPETCSPSERCDEPYRDWGRQRSAQTRSHEDDPVRASDLFCRKPLGEASGCIWKSAGFTSAKEKPECEQRNEIPGQPRGHREGRPP